MPDISDFNVREFFGNLKMNQKIIAVIHNSVSIDFKVFPFPHDIK
jgi:hypothetical protein